MRGDFHIHTIYSDGVYTPEEIKNLASDLDYIAITDHDVLSGALEAYHLQAEKPKIIVGVELSTQMNDESIHILGYFNHLSRIDELNSFLINQRSMRYQRALKMKELLLTHFQIDLNMEFAKKIESVTRGTIANQIIAQGYPYTKEEIFQKMIGHGCVAYLPSTKMTTQYGIKLIKENGGLAVLAHPILLRKTRVEEIINLGIDGIEAIYSKNSSEDTDKYKKIARDYQLFITAGSDFHSPHDHKHGEIGEVVLEGKDLEIFLNKLMEVK